MSDGTKGLYPTLDAHVDSLMWRLNQGRSLDLADPVAEAHVDLERMRTGGMATEFLYVGDMNLTVSAQLVGAVEGMAVAHPEALALCRSGDEVRAAHGTGHIALVMTIEGMDMFGERIEALETWLRLGVRVASLTHGEGKEGGSATALQTGHSYFGYLPPKEREGLRRQGKGLTGFAREALEVLAEWGVPCDMAHMNDAAFWETLEIARGPLCYTHGNCYTLCPHSRNPTDEMMRALAERGGVLGMTVYEKFVDPENPTVERAADHFMHALEVMGPDHVGLGTDFDGIPAGQRLALRDVSEVPLLWQALEARGVDAETIGKVAQENFLGLLP